MASGLMPIRLDYTAARRRFAEALESARSGRELPATWLERARKVGQSPNRTFIAMLGTALLAKATNPEVDAFSLKTRKLPRAYSARALCKDVLMPAATTARINMGATGREPLNNQPFFRDDRVGPDMAVHARTRPHLDYLCDCLRAVERLDAARALEALGAFLRVREQEGARPPAPRLGPRVLGVPSLVAGADRFVTRNPEGGRRGQALVAGCLSLVFADVETSRVNDPSRHWPGDVAVWEDAEVSLVAEVKQRPATGTEILQLVERCAAVGIKRAMVATLHPEQPALPVDDLRREAWQRHGVHLSIFERADDVISNALTWTAVPLDEALTSLPQLIAQRLEELEVSREGMGEWAALFANGTA